MSNHLAVVAGGGGFIGGHLVGELLARGHAVRAVDRKPTDDWYQLHAEADNRVLDLAIADSCRIAATGASLVYNLAADMGGMGFIENNKALCMLSVLINTNLLQAVRSASVEHYFFASSACVYAADKQQDPNNPGLEESDAYPAMPEDGYGWEKLFSERMCRHFYEDFGLPVRIGRYHNVYGPHGTWNGGREKAPAALCRKVAEAKISGSNSIEIWGDGHQTRSFMYIDDCVHGTLALSNSSYTDPVNIGSSEMVTINQLADIIEEIADCRCERRYDLSAPRGVVGRSSDNTLIREVLGWEPSIALRAGLERTYAWIFDQVSSGAPVA